MTALQQIQNKIDAFFTSHGVMPTAIFVGIRMRRAVMNDLVEDKRFVEARNWTGPTGKIYPSIVVEGVYIAATNQIGGDEVGQAILVG